MSADIFQALLEENDLSPTQQHVAQILAWHTPKGGTRVYYPQSGIARETRLSVRTVQRALNDLVKLGVLEVMWGAGGGKDPVTYEWDLQCLADITWKTWNPRHSVRGHEPSATSATASETGPNSPTPVTMAGDPRHNGVRKKRKETPDPEREIQLSELLTDPDPDQTDPVLHYPEGAPQSAPRVPQADLAPDLPHSDRTRAPDPEDREGLVVGVRWMEVPEHHDSSDLTDTLRDCDECARWAGKALFCPKCKVDFAMNPVRARARRAG